jgi:hypothetical protein
MRVAGAGAELVLARKKARTSKCSTTRPEFAIDPSYRKFSTETVDNFVDYPFRCRADQPPKRIPANCLTERHNNAIDFNMFSRPRIFSGLGQIARSTAKPQVISFLHFYRLNFASPLIPSLYDRMSYNTLALCKRSHAVGESIVLTSFR